jgi:hypothetical protein
MDIVDNIELGNASTETQGVPTGTGEFLGHNEALGIASVETQGIPGPQEEVLGMNFKPGLEAR